MPGFITAVGTVVLFGRRARLSDCLRAHGVPAYFPGVAALVKIARGVTITLVVIAGVLLLTPGSAGAGEDPADFIRMLGNQARGDPVQRDTGPEDDLFPPDASPGFRP